jgi:probable F420-dependent oxidoreductase
MKIGLMFTNAGPFGNPELFTTLVQNVEKFGFESIWTVEYVVIPQIYKTRYPYSGDGEMPHSGDVPISDPLIPLGYAAALTTKIKLATGVMILPQRNPLYVAKQIATLDLLSGGRVILGIGSGWLKEEFDALGLDFRSRGSRTDESIQAMRAVWREKISIFHGKHFNFGPVRSFPKPAQKNGVPIHIGGHSPAAARRAGRFGDGFFPALGDVARLKELFQIMRDEATTVGRNPHEIELTCLALATTSLPARQYFEAWQKAFDGIGQATLDAIKGFQDIGISRVIVPPPGFDAENLVAGLEKIANEVIARL